MNKKNPKRADPSRPTQAKKSSSTDSSGDEHITCGLLDPLLYDHIPFSFSDSPPDPRNSSEVIQGLDELSRQFEEQDFLPRKPGSAKPSISSKTAEEFLDADRELKDLSEVLIQLASNLNRGLALIAAVCAHGSREENRKQAVTCLTTILRKNCRHLFLFADGGDDDALRAVHSITQSFAVLLGITAERSPERLRPIARTCDGWPVWVYRERLLEKMGKNEDSRENSIIKLLEAIEQGRDALGHHKLPEGVRQPKLTTRVNSMTYSVFRY